MVSMSEYLITNGLLNGEGLVSPYYGLILIFHCCKKNFNYMDITRVSRHTSVTCR